MQRPEVSGLSSAQRCDNQPQSAPDTFAVVSGAVRRTLALPPVEPNEFRRVGGEVAVEDLS